MAEFNHSHAAQLTGHRTGVVVIIDGWDQGDVQRLRREMHALKRRAYRLLWLNPLLGNPDYRPVAQGMAAVLPAVDELLPVHNLASLERVGRTLMKLSHSNKQLKVKNAGIVRLGLTGPAPRARLPATGCRQPHRHRHTLA